MANVLLAKAAISLATSKQGRKAICLVLGTVVGIVLIPLLIIGNIVMGMLSVFTRDGKIQPEDLRNTQETQVYKDIRAAYGEYVAGQKRRMVELEEKYTNDNMGHREVTVYNPETQREETTEEEYCTVDIFVSEYQHIGTAYVMAYLSCKHKEDYLRNKHVVLDWGEVTSFWDGAGGKVLVSDEEEGYFIQNTVLSGEEIAEKYFPSRPMREEYLEAVSLIGQYIGQEHFLE